MEEEGEGSRFRLELGDGGEHLQSVVLLGVRFRAAIVPTPAQL